jgi:hypothetical protein
MEISLPTVRIIEADDSLLAATKDFSNPIRKPFYTLSARRIESRCEFAKAATQSSREPH